MNNVCSRNILQKIALLLSLFLFLGCVSVKTIDQAVNDRYQNAMVKKFNGSNFSLTNVVTKNDLVKTEKIKSQFIPALFYWKSSGTFEATLDNYVTLNLLNKYADDYANSIKFSEKLNGRKIELNVVSIPEKFEYKQSSTTIFLILAAATNFQNHVIPENADLKVEYKISDNSAAILNAGVIVVTAADINAYSEHLNVLKMSSASPKTFIKEYLNTYENQVYLMSKIFIDKLSLTL